MVLRDGRVQQIGTPEELHTRPANWHVADFMGYRNLVPHEVGQGGRRHRGGRAGGRARRLTGTAVGEIDDGAEVIAAVRPEDVEVLEPGKSGSGQVLGAEVEVVEYQGREFAVEVLTEDGLRLHVRTDRRLAPGDTVTLRIDPQPAAGLPRR